MDVRDALRAVRKHWLVVALVVLLGVVGGVLMVLRATPKYAAGVTFFVSTPATNDATGLVAANQFATQRVNSYVRLASSERLADMIIKQTGIAMDPVSLGNEISASADLNTVLLDVRVEDPVKARAVEIAQAVATQLPAMITQVEPAIGSAKVHLTVVSGPRLDPGLIRPSRFFTIGLGLLAGLVVAVLYAVLRELLDTSMRSVEALRDVTGHPVLGSIGYDRSAKTEPLLVGPQSHGLRAEAFRQLRTNLQFTNVDKPPSVIVVTSSVAAEGKSTTCVNLALMFAETGRSTLLIEADLRRPRVTEYLALERSVGLSNILAGQVQVDEVLQRWGENLTVLSGGTIPPNPSELLGSKGMSELIKSLRRDYDLILLDTPPLLPVTDAAVASVHADGVVVVVRYGKTSRAKVSAALSSLDAVNAPILGEVLNMTKLRRSRRSSYDGYGYYENPPDAPAESGLAVAVGSPEVTAGSQARNSPEPGSPALEPDNVAVDRDAEEPSTAPAGEAARAGTTDSPVGPAKRP